MESYTTIKTSIIVLIGLFTLKSGKTQEGIGIRIEDDVLITKDGSINLSCMIPKEIKDIEF